MTHGTAAVGTLQPACQLLSSHSQPMRRLRAFMQAALSAQQAQSAAAHPTAQPLHLLHCRIIRADGNELCKLVPTEGMDPTMELHGTAPLLCLLSSTGSLRCSTSTLLLHSLVLVGPHDHRSRCTADKIIIDESAWLWEVQDP